MNSFSATIAAFVPEARALAESRMFTTCAIQYETGTTLDPATDADVPTYTTAFESKCRVKSPGRQVSLTEVGGRTAAETTRELHLPATSNDPWVDPRAADGVFALFTAVHFTDDPTLLNQRVKLSGPAPGSQTTARRLEITEVVA